MGLIIFEPSDSLSLRSSSSSRNTSSSLKKKKKKYWKPVSRTCMTFQIYAEIFCQHSKKNKNLLRIWRLNTSPLFSHFTRLLIIATFFTLLSFWLWKCVLRNPVSGGSESLAQLHLHNTRRRICWIVLWGSIYQRIIKLKYLSHVFL